MKEEFMRFQWILLAVLAFCFGKVRSRCVWALSFLLCFGLCTSCDDDAVEEKYNPSIPVTFEKFSPEKGGSTTQLIITGTNFGNDANLVKVKVGNREARVVGVSPTKIYAVVRARSVDASGETSIEVTVADNQPHVFEKKFDYELTQMVSTFAGKGEQGQEDGDALSAKFDSPTWLAFDKDGILYVIEEYGGLRTIDQSGMVSTLFTYTGQRQRAISFSYTQDTLFMAMDQDGKENPPVNYMLRDNGFSNPRAFVRGATHKCNTVAVNPVDGYVFWTQYSDGGIYYAPPQESSKFQEATGFTKSNDLEAFNAWSRDGKTFYRIAKGKHVIYRRAYNPYTHTFEGNQEVLAGEWGQSGNANGPIGQSRLFDPWQLVEDEDGNVYVCDRGNNLIRKITPDGVTSIFAGSGKEGLMNGLPLSSSFKRPEGIAMDKDGAIYVADRENRVIRKIVVE